MSGPYPGDGAADGPRWYPRGAILAGGRGTVSVPGREPPHNREAEAGVLGSILLDPSVLPGVIEVLRPEHFWDDRHRLLYRTLLRLHERGTPIDPITLREELVNRGEFDGLGGDDFLMTLLDGVPHAVNAVYWAKIVRGKAVGRILAEEAEETIRAVYSQAYAPEELIERASRGVARAEADVPPPDGEEGPAAEPGGYPGPVAPAAYHGLAGDFVRLVGPHTEADSLAVLFQFLTMIGSVVGRNPYWRSGPTKHRMNEFVCLVGVTSAGRKGTALDAARIPLEWIDPTWVERCNHGGMVSGEGLIEPIRDPAPYRKGGEQLIAEGVDEKRALWVEEEFGSVLDASARDGCTLGAVLRKMWDGKPLSSKGRNNPVRCGEPHGSVIAHITFSELAQKLRGSDLYNGFANRFLWVCVKRSKRLPHGGRIDEIDFADFERRLGEAVEFARNETLGELLLRRDEEADRLWEAHYDALTDGHPGILGAVTSRGAPHVMRLASIYALLDRTIWIRRRHLEAGLALWRYAEESAAFIFADRLGDRDAEKLAAALKEAGDAGLDATGIRRRVFRNGYNAGQIDRILGVLRRSGMAELVEVATGGRPRQVWRSVAGT